MGRAFYHIHQSQKGGIKEKMNTIRKIRKNAKALSPVVASIILIAVTVAVSIAVAAWMGALVVGQMQTEELKITNIQFDPQSSNKYINLTISNTAATSSTLDQALVDSQSRPFILYATSGGAAVTPTTISPNAKGWTIQIEKTWVSGNNYAFKLVTTKGNYYTYTAIAP